jgi:hydroxyethylthiazole kinase-like uncharacterized protein yjeF
MRILTVEEMRRVEKAADQSGHSYAEMMERAGRGVAKALMARQDVKGRRILVLVGPGNNGGDGLVAARYLAEAGAEVACYLLKPRDDDPNFKAVRERELFITDASADKGWRKLRKLVAGADVILDALLGTGVRLPLKGTVVKLLAQVGEGLVARRAEQAAGRTLRTPARPASPLSTPLVVGVDGPSGLDYDSGDLAPQATPVDLTVTFAYPKRGHFLFPGAAACGDLMVADIGIGHDLAQKHLGEPTLEVATAEMVGALLPERPRDAHKGTFGKALLVVGSINYTGAAYLSASGATRVGAGLVTLAVPGAIHDTLAAKISEATYLILSQSLGIVAPDAVKLLAEKMRDYHAMLLGSGLTQEKEAVEFVHELLQAEAPPKRKRRIGFQSGDASSSPAGADEEDVEEQRLTFPRLVVDADGLNALAVLEGEEWWRRLPAPAVLTPHPGEMARLMGVGTKEVQADRVGVAREMAPKWGHVIVLKGAHTVVANPDGRTVVLPFATAALATAGSGDVLAGAIAGLLAQGLAPFDAALAGAYLHGLAGSWAGEEIGLAGAVASDLLPRLPRALARVRLARA